MAKVQPPPPRVGDLYEIEYKNERGVTEHIKGTVVGTNEDGTVQWVSERGLTEASAIAASALKKLENSSKKALMGGFKEGDRAFIAIPRSDGSMERVSGTIVGMKDGQICWVSDRSEKRAVSLIAARALTKE